MAASTPASRQYYPALNGLRAVAAILVFTQHYLSQIPGPANWLTTYCWVGVDLFFVLSGFLITGNLYDARNAPHRLRRFYWHRIVRVYPLFYGVLLLIFVAGVLMQVHWRPVQILYPLNLGNYARFFFHPPTSVGVDTIFPLRPHTTHLRPLFFAHFWSLCVEEQFYFIWPFIIFGVRNRRRLLAICCAIIVVEPALRYLGVLYLPGEWTRDYVIYLTLPFRCDALAFGGLLALLRRGPQWERLVRYHRGLLVGGCAAIALPAVLFKLRGQSPLPFRTPLMASLGFTLVDLGAAAILVALTVPHTRVSRLLTTRWIQGLGTISYGFYVFHDIPAAYYYMVAHRFFPRHDMLALYVIGFVSTTLLAMLSWRFYERFFLAYKHRFDPGPRAVAARQQRPPAGGLVPVAPAFSGSANANR